MEHKFGYSSIDESSYSASAPGYGEQSNIPEDLEMLSKEELLRLIKTIGNNQPNIISEGISKYKSDNYSIVVEDAPSEMEEELKNKTQRPYYWNSNFQRINSQIRDQDVFEEEQLYDEMRQLASDFIFTAKMFGQIIISEKFLPYEEKSIKPIDSLGGVAGGEKYICQDILFKFAVDKHKIYGGDEFAAKAAGHELKGLVQVYQSRVTEIRTSMMCLIDSRGYRLVAMDLLPISHDTIAYGSNDGGFRVHNKSPALFKCMEKVSKHLNLKPHIVGFVDKTLIYGPADIEGHLGTDGNFYLCDFARLFPPEAPTPNAPRSAHLYRLLRPEFVRLNNHPLSSDAYTKFGEHDQRIHNEEVWEATKRLHELVIPSFAKNLDEIFTEKEATRLTEMIHREIHRPAFEPYRKPIVDFLNLIFGNSPEFWKGVIKKEMTKYFANSLTEEEKNADDFPLSKIDKRKLFKRVITLCGIELKPNFVLDTGSGHPFEDMDLTDISTRVKEMPILHYSAATVFYLKGRKRGIDAKDKSRFLEMAEQRYQAALSTTPDDHMSLCNTAMLLRVQEKLLEAEKYFKMAIRASSHNARILGQYAWFLHSAVKKYDEAEKYYVLGLEQDPNHPRILGDYAYFLFSVKKDFKKADEYFQRCLAAKPDYRQGMADYAAFLKHTGDKERARKYDEKVKELGAQQQSLMTSGKSYSNSNETKQETINYMTLFESKQDEDPSSKPIDIRVDVNQRETTKVSSIIGYALLDK